MVVTITSGPNDHHGRKVRQTTGEKTTKQSENGDKIKKPRDNQRLMEITVHNVREKGGAKNKEGKERRHFNHIVTKQRDQEESRRREKIEKKRKQLAIEQQKKVAMEK